MLDLLGFTAVNKKILLNTLFFSRSLWYSVPGFVLTFYFGAVLKEAIDDSG